MNNQRMKRKKERQKELAKLFYEMGMDQDLIASISGLTDDEMKEAISVDKVETKNTKRD